jgi:tetratricopeptide (TPR) repeat protein
VKRNSGARYVRLVAALACLALTACASTSQASRKDATRQGFVDVNRSLAVADYQRALDLLEKHASKDPDDKNLQSRYVAAIEEIKKTADRSREKGDYERAAAAYGVLADGWARFSKLEAKLTFGRAGILARLRECRVRPSAPQGPPEPQARGDHQEALGLLVKQYLEERRDRKLPADFLAAVEEIKKDADSSRDKGNFGQAAGIYRILLDSWAGMASLEAKLSFNRAAIQSGLKACRIGILGIQAHQEFEAGRHDKALAIYEAAIKDYPGDKILKAGCEGLVADIKAGGAKALADRDYAQAGRDYALLLKHFASLDGLGAGAGLDPGELAETIKLCSSNLTKRGLAEYRKGSLDKAIAAWESLLAFDPDNAEIKKAVETARAQLGRLRILAPAAVGQGQAARGFPKAGR